MKRLISFLLLFLILVSCIPLSVSAQRDVAAVEIPAQELKELGLFLGVSDTDFALGRAPSRAEAIVMLIRILGKESEALDGTWAHPFDDVPEWADPYIGYAYTSGLTMGISDTKFGEGDASAAMYLTFVLRALGYSDTEASDFTWDNPYALAEAIGILDENVNLEVFWRADVVLVSHAALQACLKGTVQTLAQKLISAGVFSQYLYDRVCCRAQKTEAALSPFASYIDAIGLSTEKAQQSHHFRHGNDGTA